MLIYDKTTKRVLMYLNENQIFDIYFQHYSQDFRDNLGMYDIDKQDVPINYTDYKIINGELVEDIEIKEPIEQISNKELQERIVELENIIDVILGGIEDGI
ncbi:MAG TPA: hypothetical protein VFC79_09970 [Tissierellaceae bacterium]|nr:hypothetical protein [Tissierellaceae bacterium]